MLGFFFQVPGNAHLASFLAACRPLSAAVARPTWRSMMRRSFAIAYDRPLPDFRSVSENLEGRDCFG